MPTVGTTIFTVMSKLAAEHGAINLSQGFPDFDAPPELLERAVYHLTHGHNQYAPMAGVVALREQVARKVLDLYGSCVDSDTEITITAGATEAIFCAITATVRPGDEVIVFDPAYDCYEPTVTLAGGVDGSRAAVGCVVHAGLGSRAGCDHAANTIADRQHAAQSNRVDLARRRHGGVVRAQR